MPFDRQQLAAISYLAAAVRGDADPSAGAEELLAGMEAFLGRPANKPVRTEWRRDPVTGLPHRVAVSAA